MKNTPSHPGIKQLPIGKPFITFCVIRQKAIQYKQNGDPYLILELGDHSGRLKAKLWDHPEHLSQQMNTGDILKIKAVLQVFKDRKELKLLQFRAAMPEDNISLSDLLPRSVRDPETLKRQLRQHIDSITNQALRELLQILFNDSRLTEAYFQSPAGKLWHHNYLSGLLEHVIVLLDVAQCLTSHYPQIDIDLLKCGIICHNIGKVEEYALNGYVEFSDQGRLLGYTAMGYQLLHKKIDQIQDFPPNLKKRLLHLLLSHEGEQQPTLHIPPMTLEAVLLTHLIRLDANVNAICRILENDVLPESNWSKYIPLLDRFIYTDKQHPASAEPQDESFN